MRVGYIRDTREKGEITMNMVTVSSQPHPPDNLGLPELFQGFRMDHASIIDQDSDRSELRCEERDRVIVKRWVSDVRYG